MGDPRERLPVHIISLVTFTVVCGHAIGLVSRIGPESEQVFAIDWDHQFGRPPLTIWGVLEPVFAIIVLG